MSPEHNFFANQKHQQKSKLIKVFRSKTIKLFDREFLVALLFLLGSILFLCDGLIELAEGISIHVFLHIPASLMFVVGSYLFMPTTDNK